MASSKENQEALNNLVEFADPFDRDEFNRVSKWEDTLQQAINDLELYKKAYRLLAIEHQRINVMFPLYEKIEEEYLEKAKQELKSEKR